MSMTRKRRTANNFVALINQQVRSGVIIENKDRETGLEEQLAMIEQRTSERLKNIARGRSRKKVAKANTAKYNATVRRWGND